MIAGGYKEIFAPASYVDTGLDVRTEVRTYLQNNSPVSAQLDGRITQGATPAALPTTGGEPASPWPAMLAGVALLSLGLLVRRRVAPPA